MRKLVVVLIAVLSVCLAQPALAASEADKTECSNGRQIEAVVEACTRIIDDRGSTATERYQALQKRASATIAEGKMGRPAGLPRAVADASEMIRLNGSNAKGYQLRADARAELGEMTAAIADYDLAIRYDPSASNYFERGYAHMLAGSGAPALKDFDEYLRRDQTELVSALFNKASVHTRMGSYDDAVRSYDEGLAKAPSEHGRLIAITGRAEAYFHKGQPTRAIAELRPILANTSPDAAAFRCPALFLFNRSAEAVEACSDAIKQGGEFREPLGFRGMAHLKLKNDALALADLQLLNKLSPLEPTWRYALGLAKLRTGDSTGTADLDYARSRHPHIEAVFWRFGLGNRSETPISVVVEHEQSAAPPARPSASQQKSARRSRTVFVYTTGRFNELGGGKWHETRDGGRPGSSFVETARNDKYIELFDRDRNMLVRLHDSHGAWVYAGSTNWAPWPGSQGRWEK